MKKVIIILKILFILSVTVIGISIWQIVNCPVSLTSLFPGISALISAALIFRALMIYKNEQ
jgi:hypothetical protein